MGQEVGAALLLQLAVGLVVVAAGLALVFKSKSKREPPGPTPWPIVGNLPHLGTVPHHSLAKLAKKYGPLMSMRLGSVKVVVVSSPKFAEEFLRIHDRVWASRPVTSAGKLIAYDHQDIGFAPYGPRWRFARKVFLLELFTMKRLADFQKMRTKGVVSMVDAVLDRCSDGSPVEVDATMINMVMNIVLSMLMNGGPLGDGARSVREEARFHEIIKEHFILAGVFVIGDFIPWLDRFDLQGFKKRMIISHKNFDDFLQAVLDDHRQKLEEDEGKDKVQDMVDVLLTRPSDADGENLTDSEIKGILVDVVSAGADTASNTIVWALSELIKNPHVLAKAQAEIDALVGRERLVEESDLPKLPYLQAIVKETFRLHPVGPLLIPHESTGPCEIAGYRFAAKTRLFVNVYAIHRDPQVWVRPTEFVPERFMASDRDVHGMDFDLLPFGSGRRMCPGKSFGILMVQYALAVLIHACDWRLTGGQKIEDLDMGEGVGLTCPRRNPLSVVAMPRLPLRLLTIEQVNTPILNSL